MKKREIPPKLRSKYYPLIDKLIISEILIWISLISVVLIFIFCVIEILPASNFLLSSVFVYVIFKEARHYSIVQLTLSVWKHLNDEEFEEHKRNIPCSYKNEPTE